ncbi:MAG: BrnT family toxin [Candidatus Binatia bacterium]
MQVVWDPPKAELNQRKHGVRFSDAEGVLYDPHAITGEDKGTQGERRYVGRVLVVVYTYRGDSIRLISARRATRGERRSYEEGA